MPEPEANTDEPFPEPEAEPYKYGGQYGSKRMGYNKMGGKFKKYTKGKTGKAQLRKHCFTVFLIEQVGAKQQDCLIYKYGSAGWSWGCGKCGGEDKVGGNPAAKYNKKGFNNIDGLTTA